MAGDPHTQPCWQEVYTAHRKELFLIALSITGRRELAEDAVHDAFVQLYSRRRRARNPKTYAFQAVRNCARMIVRGRHRTGEPGSARSLEDEVQGKEESAARRAEESETAQRLQQALNRLNESEREVVVLKLHSNLTFHEIAEVLRRPLGTVVSQYQRSLEKVRTSLKMSYSNG